MSTLTTAHTTAGLTLVLGGLPLGPVIVDLALAGASLTVRDLAEIEAGVRAEITSMTNRDLIDARVEFARADEQAGGLVTNRVVRIAAEAVEREVDRRFPAAS